MIAETSAIDGIYTLAQTVLNVLFAVCILKLKRRSEDRADTVDQRMEFLCDRIERIERKLP